VRPPARLKPHCEGHMKKTPGAPTRGHARVTRGTPAVTPAQMTGLAGKGKVAPLSEAPEHVRNAILGAQQAWRDHDVAVIERQVPFVELTADTIKVGRIELPIPTLAAVHVIRRVWLDDNDQIRIPEGAEETELGAIWWCLAHQRDDKGKVIGKFLTDPTWRPEPTELLEYLCQLGVGADLRDFAQALTASLMLLSEDGQKKVTEAAVKGRLRLPLSHLVSPNALSFVA